jgi:hypothetical protein
MHHNVTHGLTRKDYPLRKLYDVWRQMHQRCYNPACKDYPAYGARGINVCDAWHSPQTFISWCVASGYQEGLTIERQNVNANYAPNNCTWIPNPRQAANTRKNRRISYAGKTMCLSDWSRETGIHIQTLLMRLRQGWEIHEALCIPPRRGRNQYGDQP